MAENKVYSVIGLMSGTSLDGVDAALIRTDGWNVVEPVGFVSIPYPQDLRESLRACFGKTELDSDGKTAEHAMTMMHARAVKELVEKHPNEDISLIGFHGQTIFHDPGNQITVQIGDAELLAKETGRDVVYDFRSRDVKHGGQGAPLIPIYHQALVKKSSSTLQTKRYVSIVNVGGVANLTWIDRELGEILAFDTGPGNALMDDYMSKYCGQPYDRNGALAAQGVPDPALIKTWLAHPYFAERPPKSLDRDEWDIADLGPLANDLKQDAHADNMATLLHFTALSLLHSLKKCPAPNQAMYLCGGGRHNTALVEAMQHGISYPLGMVEDLGWDGDATEAEGFAYMAVRYLRREPISFPLTTGVKMPMTGGKLISIDTLAA